MTDYEKARDDLAFLLRNIKIGMEQSGLTKSEKAQIKLRFNMAFEESKRRERERILSIIAEAEGDDSRYLALQEVKRKVESGKN